jgi:hypothetical protein
MEAHATDADQKEKDDMELAIKQVTKHGNQNIPTADEIRSYQTSKIPAAVIGWIASMYSSKNQKNSTTIRENLRTTRIK